MFDKSNFVAEIEASMQSNLVGNGIEKQAELMNKFAKALDYLNHVAEIFDELGLQKEAEATTTLLEVVAKKKRKSKSKSKSKTRSKAKKTDSATKDLTSEKMVENLKEKGWVFNADDGHHDSCMCMDCMSADDFDMSDARDHELARMFHDLEDDEVPRFPRSPKVPDFYDHDEDEHLTMSETPAAKRRYDLGEDHFDWESLRPANRETLPSTPAAKRHHSGF